MSLAVVNMNANTKDTLKFMALLLLLAGWIATEVIDQMQETLFYAEYHRHSVMTESYMKNLRVVDASATVTLSGIDDEFVCSTVMLRDGAK
jgi:hypothetical protein